MILIDKKGHLVSDTSFQELHHFAVRIGLRRIWFQHDRKRIPHYDVRSEAKRIRAIQLGATLVSSKDIVKRALRESKALRLERP